MLMEHVEGADEAMDVIAAGGGLVGLMTAALLDVAGVRVEVYERGSKARPAVPGTAMHPRALEVLTMIGAGDGRRISDVLLAQGRRVPDTHRAGMPDLLDYRGLDTSFPFTLTLPQWGTEHALAVYLDARGVWVRHGAEVTAAGQSTDEARVQVSGAWHTARYLVGTDGAHSMVRKAAGIGFHGGVPDQVGWVGDVKLAGPVEHARHHWHQEPGHANVVPLGGCAARVYGTHAGDSQLAAGQARRQKAPFSLAGLSATLTAISGIGFDAHSPSWLARSSNTGQRDAASLGLELAATRTVRPGSHATHSVMVIPAVN
jgi:2-polyprenyl-6-methoxyphenol hydroxylase-like FAD-dependent oxidoreductase